MSTSPLPAWPDVTERDRWAAALADVARRIERDRGVAEPWRLEVAGEHLAASYGGTRVLVAGPGPDVSGSEELFDEVDTWVAVERPGGPGRVLDRDVRRIADWRARLPAAQRRWQEATTPVLCDVRSTTRVELHCRVTVQMDLPAWPGPFPVGTHDDRALGVVGEVLGIEHPADEDAALHLLATPLDFPQLQLELTTADSWTGHGVPVVDDDDEAVLHVADLVQDLVVEQVFRAWPVCPGHSHPMQPGPSDTGPVWRCPGDERVAVPIGRLGGARTSRIPEIVGGPQ